MARGVLLSFLVVLAGCHAGPMHAGRTARCGAEAEALAGRTAAPLLELRCGGVTRDPEAERAFEAAGCRMAPFAPDVHACHVQLLSTSGINAYSLPGGRVYVTRGLYVRIRGDEALMAAVLAHEAAHITHKDSLRPNCADAAEALEREVAADTAGAGWLADAGYPADALVRLLQVTADVQPPGWADIRIERIRRGPAASDKNRVVIVSR